MCIWNLAWGNQNHRSIYLVSFLGRDKMRWQKQLMREDICLAHSSRKSVMGRKSRQWELESCHIVTVRAESPVCSAQSEWRISRLSSSMFYCTQPQGPRGRQLINQGIALERVLLQLFALSTEQRSSTHTLFNC